MSMRLLGQDYGSASTALLLKRLIGARKARRLYQGSLQPFFAPTANQAETAEACLIALELTKRWLAEQLTDGPVLTSPKTVRDYLRIHYAGREYESFSVLFLDAQHRLIRAEELFRGTLTQTSVYPREVVKAACSITPLPCYWPITIPAAWPSPAVLMKR